MVEERFHWDQMPGVMEDARNFQPKHPKVSATKVVSQGERVDGKSSCNSFGNLIINEIENEPRYIVSKKNFAEVVYLSLKEKVEDVLQDPKLKRKEQQMPSIKSQ